MAKEEVQPELPTQDPPESEEEATTSRRPVDKEVRVLGQVLRTLEDVEEPARQRIVAFISSRYKGS